jgi:hypothetical protein
MSDDKGNRGPQDRLRINLQEDYELRYWTEKFGVTAEELKTAVKKVGVMAANVEQELNKSK